MVSTVIINTCYHQHFVVWKNFTLLCHHIKSHLTWHPQEVVISWASSSKTCANKCFYYMYSVSCANLYSYIPSPGGCVVWPSRPLDEWIDTWMAMLYVMNILIVVDCLQSEIVNNWNMHVHATVWDVTACLVTFWYRVLEIGCVLFNWITSLEKNVIQSIQKNGIFLSRSTQNMPIHYVSTVFISR
mgnify:CR=1 FL=1